jgi:hypothetical protein
VVWYVFDHTAFGQRLLFAGQSRDVARLNGVNVAGLRWVSMIISGGIAGLAGVVYTGTTASADPVSGAAFLLPAFAACFLGSTVLKIGRFNPWGTLVAVYFLVTAPVVIDYDVTGENNPTRGASLASAGSNFVSDDPGFWRTVVQNKLLSGVDSNGAAADGEITWNWAYSWSLGDTVDGASYDFDATALHELLHSFGFLSNVDEAGENTGQQWTLLDSFIVNSDGRKPIGTDFRWNTAFDPRLTGDSGGLYFGGSNAVAAYDDQYVPLFTPSVWEDGSSMSHLDDATFTGSNQKLMNAATGTGLGVRVLSPFELGILTDIGYVVVTPQTSNVAGSRRAV